MAPVLTLLEVSEGYTIHCDTSRVGLSNVLMQHRRFVAYASRKLRTHEQNYPTHDLELSSGILSLKIWCHNLYGVHVKVFTKH